MEDGSTQNTRNDNPFLAEPTKPMSELETMQQQHDEKLSRTEELKGKKEAMMVELEKKKNENPEKMKGFNELSEKYNNRRDQLFSLLAERSKENKK
ncbi:hypothetical protein CDL12_14814 [Handroanthus impetiginosus]|uniref:Uncharacterized protein n=1 Tax=Handroanthus impetiginosus TaxID=429701 RepID=A0A2G9H4Z0_9LAMI|nr:hypothetical protein CDL12_14814 [Handroanthus impetiginosus]